MNTSTFKKFALALCCGFAFTTASFGQVLINEFSPDPTVGEAVGGEWIELYNAGTAAVNIGGWIVTSGSCPGTMTTCGYSVIMPTGLVIPPSGILLISNSNLFSCPTCDWAGLHTALGVIPTAPTGVADFAAGKADAAFLDLATCGCAVSAAGCTTLPAANTAWVLNNATAATDGERIGLFNSSGTLVDAVYYELGNQQEPAANPIVTNAGTIGTYTNANALTLPATSNTVYVSLGTLVDGCTSSYNRVPDGGSWGLNTNPSRKGTGGNQTTATDSPTPGFKNDYSDNGSPNAQPFNFFANGTIIQDAEDTRTGATLIYGVPSNFIGGATGNTFATQPASTTNRAIISCTTGGGTVTLKSETYNFQHVEENSVLASATSGTGSSAAFAGSYITVGIDGATPTATPANSNGTLTGTTGWTEQGGSSGLTPGNSSILPDATGKTILNKTLTLPTVANCEVKTALYNMIVKNYGNSTLCGAGRSGNSSSTNNPVGIGNTTSSDCWDGASYLVTLVGRPNAPTATSIAGSPINSCTAQNVTLSATPCAYAALPANGAPVIGAGIVKLNPTTQRYPTGTTTVYAFTKVVITPTAGVSTTGPVVCYSTPTTVGTVVNNLSGCGALPVELLSFKGYNTPYANILDWTTASEINSNRFEIERSTNGKDFEVVGTVKSIGNSTQIQKYSFSDAISGSMPMNYYRLKDIDNNGDFGYSNVIIIKAAAKSIAIDKVYPNPFNTVLNIEISAEIAQSGLVSLVDISGKIVYEQIINLKSGSNLTNLNVDALPSGMYAVVVRSGREVVSMRVIK